MKTSSKKIIIKIITIIVLLIITDCISGTILDRFYRSCKSGLCYQENYIMRKTNQDVLVLGSSRAEYHYVPSILSNSLKLSVYNCGREGVWLYYHYGVLISTLNRYTPKVIVLEVDLKDIYKDKDNFGKEILTEHAPFYKKISPEFDSLMRLNGKKEICKMQSNLYCYNSKFFKIITGNLVSKPDNILGFMSQNGSWNKEIDVLERNEFTIDSEKVKTLRKFISKAKQHNIKIVLAVSPYFKIIPTDLFEPLKVIAKQSSIPFFNHVSDSVFLKDKTLFHDDLHLNLKGATIYSSVIAGELNNYLNESLKEKRFYNENKFKI